MRKLTAISEFSLSSYSNPIHIFTYRNTLLTNNLFDVKAITEIKIGDRMKLKLLFLIIISTKIIFAQTSTAPSNFSDPTAGTEVNPWLISSHANLYWLTQNGIYYSNKSCLQTNDIDASGWNYVPSNSSMSFTGTYDGNNYKITGITINRAEAYNGLFGKTDGATIKNVNIENANIAALNYTGGIAGSSNATTITNCHISGLITNASYSWPTQDYGGIVGVTDGNSTITGCSFEGAITIEGINAGGIVGENLSSTIGNCSFSGSISSTFGTTEGGHSGGIAGTNYYSSIIENCFSQGTVYSTGSYVGGISGWNLQSVIRNSYSSCNITANSNIGGIAGFNNDPNSQINYCFSTGKISLTENGSNAGGLVGYNLDQINNSYSLSTVMGTDFVGGLVGTNVNSAAINNCYSMGRVSATGLYYGGIVGTPEGDGPPVLNSFWDTQTSLQAASGGGVGITTAEMRSVGTYTGWLFNTTGGTGGIDYYWDLNPNTNGDYPYLWWQTFPCTVTISDGSSFSPTVSVGGTNQPIGRFSIKSDLTGAIFHGIWIRLDGVRSGASNFKLWKSDDANFDSTSDTQVGIAYATDPGDGQKIWFTSLNESIATSDKYYFLTCDLSSGATGSIQPAIILRKDVMLVNALSEQTDIYLSQSSSPLPVELTSFTSAQSKNGIQLTWQSATEVNNYGFSIERKELTENHQWTEIGFVAGHGNSNSLKEYSFVDTDKPNRTVKYRLKQIDSDGKFEYSREVEVQIETPTDFALQQNYPNPFNPTTSIQYSVSSNQFVSLKIYDVLGNEVATLVNEEKQPGVYNYELEIINYELTSGVYFYQLRSGNFVQTKKMIVLK